MERISNINRFSPRDTIWLIQTTSEFRPKSLVSVSPLMNDGFCPLRLGCRDGNPSAKIRTGAYSLLRLLLGRKFGKNRIQLPALLPLIKSTKSEKTILKAHIVEQSWYTLQGKIKWMMRIIRKSQLFEKPFSGFQSFDGLAGHQSNVLPVNLEQIIEHCSTSPRFWASSSRAGESFLMRRPSPSSFFRHLCLVFTDLINLSII